MKHIDAWLFILTPFSDAQAVEFEAIRHCCQMDYCDQHRASPSLSAATARCSRSPRQAGRQLQSERARLGRVREPPRQRRAEEVIRVHGLLLKTHPYAFDFYDGHWQATALKPGDDEAVCRGRDGKRLPELLGSLSPFSPSRRPILLCISWRRNCATISRVGPMRTSRSISLWTF